MRGTGLHAYETEPPEDVAYTLLSLDILPHPARDLRGDEFPGGVPCTILQRGIQQIRELGVIDTSGHITRTGRALSHLLLPVRDGVALLRATACRAHLELAPALAAKAADPAVVLQRTTAPQETAREALANSRDDITNWAQIYQSCVASKHGLDEAASHYGFNVRKLQQIAQHCSDLLESVRHFESEQHFASLLDVLAATYFIADKQPKGWYRIAQLDVWGKSPSSCGRTPQSPSIS